VTFYISLRPERPDALGRRRRRRRRRLRLKPLKQSACETTLRSAGRDILRRGRLKPLEHFAYEMTLRSAGRDVLRRRRRRRRRRRLKPLEHFACETSLRSAGHDVLLLRRRRRRRLKPLEHFASETDHGIPLHHQSSPFHVGMARALHPPLHRPPHHGEQIAATWVRIPARVGGLLYRNH
jgi:hypothetical protein